MRPALVVMPEVVFDVSDTLQLESSFPTKWVSFADLDSDDLSKDHVNLTGEHLPALGTACYFSRTGPAKGR
jgi:hypothetical protein